MEETTQTVTGNETPEEIKEVGTEGMTAEEKTEIAANAEAVELAEGETIDSEAPVVETSAENIDNDKAEGAQGTDAAEATAETDKVGTPEAHAPEANSPDSEPEAAHDDAKASPHIG